MPDNQNSSSEWRTRGYLPHFDSDNKVQHVTFRLSDSLPREVLDLIIAEIAQLPPDRQDLERRKRVEEMVDRGHGCCVLREAEIAELVEKSLLSFDGQRYHLLAWVVMPNHVHVMLQALGGRALGKIVGSWKSYTGSRIAMWCRTRHLEMGDGRVWYREYWDRFIRDERHFAAAVDYIHRNPVKAGQAKRPEDWRWSSIHRWAPHE